MALIKFIGILVFITLLFVLLSVTLFGFIFQYGTFLSFLQIFVGFGASRFIEFLGNFFALNFFSSHIIVLNVWCPVL